MSDTDKLTDRERFARETGETVLEGMVNAIQKRYRELPGPTKSRILVVTAMVSLQKALQIHAMDIWANIFGASDERIRNMGIEDTMEILDTEEHLLQECVQVIDQDVRKKVAPLFKAVRKRVEKIEKGI